MMPMRSDENHQLRWLDVLDDRFEWLNVADWEPQNGGLQPVRVPKFWRDQWPSRTARRGKSAAAWHCGSAPTGNGSAIRRKIRCVPHDGPCRGANETDPLYHSDSESRRPENRWQSKWRETRFLSRRHCQCRTPAATIRFESLLPRWPYVDR